MYSNSLASSKISRLRLFREAYTLVVCTLFAPSACCCTCHK